RQLWKQVIIVPFGITERPRLPSDVLADSTKRFSGIKTQRPKIVNVKETVPLGGISLERTGRRKRFIGALSQQLKMVLVFAGLPRCKPRDPNGSIANLTIEKAWKKYRISRRAR